MQGVYEGVIAHVAASVYFFVDHLVFPVTFLLSGSAAGTGGLCLCTGYLIISLL